MAEYRFILRHNAADHIAMPIWKTDMAKEYAFESGQMFRRATLSGDLVFLDKDYDWIMSQPFAAKIIVNLQVSWLNNGVYVNYWQGEFYRTDCTINVDDKSIKVKPNVSDKYNAILAGLEKEYDLIPLKPAIQAVKMKRRPMLQIYTAGESIVSCFLGGMAWEQEVSDNTYTTTQLKDNFHFGAIGQFVQITFAGTPPEGLGGSFNGMWQHGSFQGEWDDFSNEQGVYYMAYFQYIDIDPMTSERSYVNGLRIYTIGTTTPILWEYKQEYPESGGYNSYQPIPATFTMIGQGGRENLSASWTGVDILGRFVIAVKPTGAYDIPSDDIVTYNRNYRYCIPYTNSGIVRMTNRVSDYPTEWGKRGDGKYYEKPYLNADEQLVVMAQYPIARSGWQISSIWLQWNAGMTLTEEQLSKQMTLRDAYTIEAVIAALLSQVAPSITFAATNAYSQFLYGSNPLYNSWGRLVVTPKSNLMVAEYSQPAQKAMITLQEVFNMLKNALGCYWFIDDNNRLRIEHISYFKNGGSYSGTPAVQVNVNDLINSRNGHSWALGTSTYSFDKMDMAERYEFSWADETTTPFMGKAIEVLSPFVQQGKIEEVNIAKFNSDIDYIMLNPSNVSEEGFALMCCSVNGGVYTVTSDEIDVSDDKRVLVQNNLLAMAFLQPTFLISDMPAYRIKVNGSETTAKGIQRKKKQQISVPMWSSTSDGNMERLVQTAIGKGEVERASISLTSRMTKYTLRYDTTEQQS